MQGSLNRFAFDLFAQRLKQPEVGNALISPASIALALGMVLTGTVDQVEQDIRATLHLSGQTRTGINAGFAALQTHLVETGEGVKLALANSLWSDRNRAIPLADFVARCQESFGAEAVTLDFDAPESLDVINGWVNEKTLGKIPSIVTQDDMAMAILILINAIYFKGSWRIPFDPTLTEDGAFHLTDDATVQVPMMTRLGDYATFADADVQAIRLPYGEDERFSMVILMPARWTTLADLAAKLDSALWHDWLTKLYPRRMNLVLPRFRVEDEWDLKNPLSALGMASAFADAEGFKRMLDGPAMIGKALHKTFMEVNEEGTEAAGATVVVMTRSLPPTFTVDRPFLLAIHDAESDSILFLGQVVDPR